MYFNNIQPGCIIKSVHLSSFTTVTLNPYAYHKLRLAYLSEFHPNALNPFDTETNIRVLWLLLAPGLSLPLLLSVRMCVCVSMCVCDCRVTDSLLPSTWGGSSLTQPLEYGHNERTWQHISLALLASQFPLWETAQGLHSEWPHKRPDSLNARQAHGQLGRKCHTVRGMPIIRHTHLLSGPSKPCQSPRPPPRQPHTQPDTELTNRALRLWQNIINSAKGERRVHSVLPNLIGFDIKDVSQL